MGWAVGRRHWLHLGSGEWSGEEAGVETGGDSVPQLTLKFISAILSHSGVQGLQGLGHIPLILPET